MKLWPPLLILKGTAEKKYIYIALSKNVYTYNFGFPVIHIMDLSAQQ